MGAKTKVMLTCDMQECDAAISTDYETADRARVWAAFGQGWVNNGWDFCPAHNTFEKRKRADLARASIHSRSSEEADRG